MWASVDLCISYRMIPILLKFMDVINRHFDEVFTKVGFSPCTKLMGLALQYSHLVLKMRISNLPCTVSNFATYSKNLCVTILFIPASLIRNGKNMCQRCWCSPTRHTTSTTRMTNVEGLGGQKSSKKYTRRAHPGHSTLTSPNHLYFRLKMTVVDVQNFTHT